MAKTAEKSVKSKINNNKKAKSHKEKKPTDKLADKSEKFTRRQRYDTEADGRFAML